MNELQIFNNPEFGEVRTIVKNDEVWFVGKDIVDILGYKNGSRDINSHVDKEDKLKYQISTAGQMREQLLINESGLYSLVLSSKLPTAKKFKRWITKDVISSKAMEILKEYIKVSEDTIRDYEGLLAEEYENEE